MREIKFRCWDTGINFMYYDPECYNIYNEEDNGLHSGYEDRYGTWHQNKLMQYTGLNDKNGVEIYEGDIVKGNYVIRYGEYSFNVNDGKCSHTEKTIGFYKEDIEFKSKYQLSTIHGEYNFEVIGNIYENPELLDNE